MSAVWLGVCICLTIAIAVGVGYPVSYSRGRLTGYLKGYDAGQKTERSDAEAKINAIRHSAEQEVQEFKERGQAAQDAIEYLYQGALDEVDQLAPGAVLAGGNEPS